MTTLKECLLDGGLRNKKFRYEGKSYEILKGPANIPWFRDEDMDFTYRVWDIEIKPIAYPNHDFLIHVIYDPPLEGFPQELPLFRHTFDILVE